MIRLGVWGGDKAWGYLGCGVIRVGGIWGCDAIKVGGIFGRCVMGEVGVCVCVGGNQSEEIWGCDQTGGI